MKHVHLAAVVLGCLLQLPAWQTQAQAVVAPQPGLAVTTEVAEYRKAAALDSSQRLVDLAAFVPGLVLDIKYATPDNFTGKPAYRQARAFARLPVAEALRQVQAELSLQGLGLKLYDGYRPYAVTQHFWNVTADKRYVASPREGSRHNRGCAVDVTLVQLSTGAELPMPTAYDDFSERAHSNYKSLPPEVLRNRALLRQVMERHGFRVFPTEWWHFDFKGWKNYPLLDLPFEVLP